MASGLRGSSPATSDALKLVAKKMQGSFTVEGELLESGLAAYGDDGDDLMMTLARKVVSGDEEDAGTESMEEVFAQAREPRPAPRSCWWMSRRETVAVNGGKDTETANGSMICGSFDRKGSMAELESLTSGTLVRGVSSDGPTEVVSVKWFGDSAVELTYKTPATGAVGTRLLYRDDEPSLEVIERGLPWSFDGDGHLFRLVSEAPANPSSPPLRPYTRRSHVHCGPSASSDHGGVRLDADPPAPAISPRR